MRRMFATADVASPHRDLIRREWRLLSHVHAACRGILSAGYQRVATRGHRNSRTSVAISPVTTRWAGRGAAGKPNGPIGMGWMEQKP